VVIDAFRFARPARHPSSGGQIGAIVTSWLLCLRFLDRRTSVFPAFVTTAGWLRHRESAVRSGRFI